ncbi:GNAT family N-acetyltransferase [bacterium]|nr:GNAT family N-acetyltransferase [bacterium]
MYRIDNRGNKKSDNIRNEVINKYGVCNGVIPDIEELSWDSSHFGFEVGKCEVCTQIESLSALTDKASVSGYKLLYIFSSCEQFCLREYGLKAYQRIVYSRSLIRDYCKKLVVEYAKVKSLKGGEIDCQLLDLSKASGEYSRFRLDPSFPSYCFSELYDKWLERSVSTDMATDVLVCYDENDIPVGLLTYKIDGTDSQIGLLAVEKHNRGKGMATLLNNVYECSLPVNVRNLHVVTQGENRPARSFYERMGYKITETNYIYHLWI